MPIYEYLCESCGRVTEVMQKVSDRPPRSCPECGGRRLAKLVSRSAFQLKGGGWYADLYGSPKKKEAGKEPAKEAAGGSAAAASPEPAKKPEPPAKKPEKTGAKKAPGKAG